MYLATDKDVVMTQKLKTALWLLYPVLAVVLIQLTLWLERSGA